MRLRNEVTALKTRVERLQEEYNDENILNKKHIGSKITWQTMEAVIKACFP